MWDTDAELRMAIWANTMKSILNCCKKGTAMNLEGVALSQLTQNFADTLYNKILDLDWYSDWLTTVWAVYIMCGIIENCESIYDLDPNAVVSISVQKACDINMPPIE